MSVGENAKDDVTILLEVQYGEASLKSWSQRKSLIIRPMKLQLRELPQLKGLLSMCN